MMPGINSVPTNRLHDPVAAPIGTSWRVQIYILIAYVAWTIYALATWDSPATPIAIVATTLAWAGQWSLTSLTYLITRSKIGRFLRNRYFTGTATIFIIIAMAVITGLAFGSASYINGWALIWRITMTFLITAMVGRLYLLANTLRQEKQAQETLRELTKESTDSLQLQRLNLIDEINEIMNDALAGAASNSQRASRQLKAFAQEFLRPLSHDVSRDDSLVHRLLRPRPTVSSWIDVANAVSSRPALKPWLMAASVVLAFWVATAQLAEEAPVDVSEATGVNVIVEIDSLLVALAVLTIIFLVTALSSLLLQKWLVAVLPRLRLGVRLLLLFLAPIMIAIFVEIAIQILYVTPGFSENISSNFLDRLWFAIPIVAIAFIVVAIRAIGEIFASAERRAIQVTSDLSWELTRLQCIYAQEQQFFATQLHGPLQSIAASASMRVANVSPGTHEWDSALSEIRSDFTEAVEQLAAGPEGARNISTEMEKLRRTWTGVCDVELRAEGDVLQTLDADWVAAGVVMDICIEAVANAAIHGKAKIVRIEMGWVGDEVLQIDVTNDGSTEITSPPGLGSQTLDRMAISWSREVVEAGLRLRVVLAVPHR
jgi:hypothetical protein